MNLFSLKSTSSDFERQTLPHLDGAYRVALWLVRDPAAAEDIVQDSYLKAYKAWDRFRPGNTRAWLFVIVRRQAFDWLRRERGRALIDIADEAQWAPEDAMKLRDDDTPEQSLIHTQSTSRLRTVLMTLPLAFREAIVLKDIEGMPYKTIARIQDVPVGTVMSRLARGREMLRTRMLEAGA